MSYRVVQLIDNRKGYVKSVILDDASLNEAEDLIDRIVSSGTSDLLSIEEY